MKIPGDASPGVKQALKDLDARLEQAGVSHAPNVNLRGQRIGNASEAILGHEYVTLDQLDRAVRQARRPTTTAVADTGTTPGGDGVDGGSDDGLGGQGCSSNSGTGHVSGPLTAVLAGQIVCGTGGEFAYLKAATVDQATRDANQEQLLLRMIWHLNQAGFTAGRQRNPSGAISNDKLTVQIEGTFRAYDVFIGVNFDADMPTTMNQVFPADYQADGGTAD